MAIKGITKEQLTEALVNTVNQQEIQKKRKGFLCMFSGGIDSTAMLHSLLNNPNYERFNVYVHHIRMINREQRSDAELHAVRNIIQYYRDDINVRPFDYKESVFDTSTMDRKWSNRFPYDMDVVAFVAAQVCLAKPQIKYAAMGVMRDDFLKAAKDPQAKLRYQEAPKIFEAALYGFDPRIPKPQMLYPLQHLTKQQLIQTTPKKVIRMTWSCRHPVWHDGKPTPCGKCEPCRKRKQAGID